MKKMFLIMSVVVVASMLLVSCGTAATPTTAAPATQPPATQPPVATATQPPVAANTAAPTVPAATPTLTPYPLATAEAGKVQVRWYIGLGTGTDAGQLPIEQSVVDDFNASQSKIQLIMEVIPYASAKDTLATEIASGAGPDIVGPVGWAGSNAFYGEWADLAPLIKANNFNTSVYDSSLVSMYQTESGQVGLPFAIYPSAMEYNTALFDQAGLNYPPATYGTQYKMPDGSMVDWTWANMTKVAQLLTVDKNGKNSTESGFDKTNIVQYGFSFTDENQPEYWGAYWQAGSELVPGGAKGTYKAAIPQQWKDAWQWMYTGIWGDQPYIANNAVETSADFGSGNTFNSGKIAMTVEPSWYTCCMGNVKTWDFAAMPTYNGKVGGRIDADTFRILKTSQHLNEAFQAMAYLETTGVQKLIVGTATQAPAYGAIPAIAADRQPYLTNFAKNYPWVKNLNTLITGLKYPDHPSAEGWVPNFSEAWNRNSTFGNLLVTTSGLDLAKEEATLESDLTTIYNK
ncbi:MAG: hypothetical protein ABSB41_05595 [Anaerolineales bacterium]|jgi:multiple sugar transport system substrate-binding protein